MRKLPAPGDGDRRLMEAEMGLPRGYLDGEAEADLLALRRHRRAAHQREAMMGGEGRSRATAGQGGATGTTSAPVLWTEPTEAEELVRTLLRSIERGTVAMVGEPDLFAAEDRRKIQLGLITALRHSSHLAGRPIPDFLHALENEILRGTFR